MWSIWSASVIGTGPVSKKCLVQIPSIDAVCCIPRHGIMWSPAAVGTGLCWGFISDGLVSHPVGINDSLLLITTETGYIIWIWIDPMTLITYSFMAWTEFNLLSPVFSSIWHEKGQAIIVYILWLFFVVESGISVYLSRGSHWSARNVGEELFYHWLQCPIRYNLKFIRSKVGWLRDLLFNQDI